MKEEIRKFIREEICLAEVDFNDDDSLYELNVINSLGVMRLILFLQEKYDFYVDQSDLRFEDFETLSGIHSYIQHRRSLQDV
jgi:acyl carrier protein